MSDFSLLYYKMARYFMKTLIVSLNSKYIHSSLAAWYLKAYCEDCCDDVKVLESTINDSPDSVLSAIYLEKADVVGFSCYIWNIEAVLKLAGNLKKVSPDVRILLGGPEVSFDAKKMMEENGFIDFIISGEGEIPFRKLLEQLASGVWKPDEIDGLTYRDSGRIISNKPGSWIENLDSIPSPYTDEMLDAVGKRIMYFEASRGCPFSCAYCLSSTFEGVRNFSMERVKEDLKKLMKAGVKLVKFVDRTFNCNRKRAKEIFRFIIKESEDTVFHFEAAADLFDDEMIEILSQAPPGRIQFEIGVQTTNAVTLELIDRKTNLDIVFDNVRKLRALGNIHIHLDLIAGLPKEDFRSFMCSFDDVYRLKPHQLQLGFLKMLKGSGIRQNAGKYGYGYRDYPPYEVLYSDSMSFDEILVLKGIEDLVDRYYNSGRFQVSLEYLTETCYSSPFSFYWEFYNFCRDEGYAGKALSGRDTYTVLLEFLRKVLPQEKVELLKDLMKLDYLSSDNSNNLPEGIEREIQPGFKERCFEFLKDEGNLKKYLPELFDMPAKQIYKQVHFETFRHDVVQGIKAGSFERKRTVVLFKYYERDRVTGQYRYIRCDEDFPPEGHG